MNFKRERAPQNRLRVASLLLLGFVFQNCQKDGPSNPHSNQSGPQSPATQRTTGDIDLMLELSDQKRLLKEQPRVTLTTGKGQTFELLPKDDGEGMDHKAGDNLYAAPVTLPIKYYAKVVIQSGSLRWEVEASYCKASLNECNIEFMLDSKDKAYQIRRGVCEKAGIARPSPKEQHQQKNPDMRSPGIVASKPLSTAKTPPKESPKPPSTGGDPPKADLPSSKDDSKADLAPGPSPGSTEPGARDVAMAPLATPWAGAAPDFKGRLPTGLLILGASLLGFGIILAVALTILGRKDNLKTSPADDDPEDE